MAAPVGASLTRTSAAGGSENRRGGVATPVGKLVASEPNANEFTARGQWVELLTAAVAAHELMNS